MPLAKFNFRPGINKETTDYTDEGGWTDGNLVRFQSGLPQKIGGWEKYSQNSFLGSCRTLFEWSDFDGNQYVGVGTNRKFYVLNQAVFYDITPLRSTVSATDVMTTNGTTTVKFTVTGHGCATGDFVTISGLSGPVNGIPIAEINANHAVAVVDANNFNITVTTQASGSTSNTGGTLTFAFEIPVGEDLQNLLGGWGSGTWNAGSWGFGATGDSFRLWNQDNYGEDLIMNYRGGGIYKWDESAGTNTRATDITADAGAILAPTKANQVIVSERDGHVVALGVDPISGASRTGTIDPMIIAISNQNSAVDWQIRTDGTSTADQIELNLGSEIIGGLQTRQEILVWTDIALFSLRFVGGPLPFTTSLLARGPSILGPNAAVNGADATFWMDKSNFYVYTGSVQALPCTVKEYVFNDINYDERYKIFGFSNQTFDEVGWYYPSAGSNEIDRYVTYNYVQRTWAIGKMERTAWIDYGIYQKPRAAGGSSPGYVYAHEVGYDDDGAPMDNVSIQSGDIDIGDGEQFAFVSRVIPDFKFIGTDGAGPQTVDLIVKMRDAPGGTLVADATIPVDAETQVKNIRGRGRQFSLNVSSFNDGSNNNANRLGVGWRLGSTRLDVKPDGRQ